MRHLSKLVICLCMGVLLTNCSSSSALDHEPMNNSLFAQNLLSNINSDSDASKQDATNSLVMSANSVSQSLKRLAEIEHAAHPNAKVPMPPSAAKIGMDNLASVDWNGAAEPLLSKLAASSNYKFQSIGKKPTLPMLVSINCKNQNVVSIIRDIGYQVQKNADIVIIPNQKLVEVRYKD